MTGPLQLLILGSDSKLRDECEAAIASLTDRQVVAYNVSDFRQAAEVVQSRRPQLVIAEMGVDLHPLKTLADDIASAAPETLIVGAFRPEAFGHEVSESAILIEALRFGVRDFAPAGFDRRFDAPAGAS